MSDEATPELFGRSACSDFPVFRKREVGWAGDWVDWASEYQSGVDAGCRVGSPSAGAPMSVCVNNCMRHNKILLTFPAPEHGARGSNAPHPSNAIKDKLFYI